MSVKTNVTLGPLVWSATVGMVNCNSGSLSAPCQTVHLSALGGGVSIDDAINSNPDQYSGTGPPHEHEPDDPPPPGHGSGGQWAGVYHRYNLTISAPGMGNTQSAAIWVWINDQYFQYMMPNPIPSDAITTTDNNLLVPCTISVSGIYLKVWTEENRTYSDGGILAFTERTLKETWFADENARVTVTAILPDKSTLQVSGPLADAGQEIELGTNFALTLSFTQHRYDVTDTIYAAFQDVKWGDEPVDFSLCELFNPGSDAPDPDNSAWGRTQTQQDCFRIGQYQNGIGTWSHNYQLGQVVNVSWSGRIWAPLWVHFKPRTGKHADDVGYPDILVEGTPVEWDEETQSFVPVPFTGEKEVKQQKKIMGVRERVAEAIEQRDAAQLAARGHDRQGRRRWPRRAAEPEQSGMSSDRAPDQRH